MDCLSEFSVPLLRAGDRLGPFAHCIRWYDEIGSTNDVAIAMAEEGAGEGCVVVAERQLAGRGRLGRSWSSPVGAGIYASVVLRPPLHAVPLLTLAAGVAVAEGIEASTGLKPALKWPNDVHVDGTHRKLAGILAEAGGQRPESPHVVIGWGINVHPAPYPPDVAGRATSIEYELGRSVDRGLLFAECLAALWNRYSDLRRHRSATVLEAWRRRARPTFGRRVEWDVDGTTASGVAADVDDSGALMVRTRDGVVRIISGEVRWLMAAPDRSAETSPEKYAR